MRSLASTPASPSLFAKPRVRAIDGLADLMCDGLAHRLDNFAFACRAAMRAEQLRH